MIEVAILKPRAGFKGGLEKQTLFLCQAFAKAGCKVTLLTTGEIIDVPEIEVVSLGNNSKLSLYNITQFNTLCKEWLEKHPVEIVFGMDRTTHQTHYRAGNGVHAVYLKRRELIEPLWKTLSFKLNPLHRTLITFEKEIFEFPGLKKIFTNSNMVKEEILSHFSTPAEKIEVVHNGVEWKAWQPAFEQSFDLKKARQPHHFLFIGNDYRRKGLPFLLKGLSLQPEKDFFLTVIGSERNIPKYQEMASKLDLEKKIVFLGPQKNVLPYYQQADTLVIPTIYDPFANVTVEALAMGLAVVTSSFNGGAEVLNDSNGIVIKDLKSPESVGEALKKAFDIPKTPENALKIRNSVKELDLSNQLDKIVHSSLASSI